MILDTNLIFLKEKMELSLHKIPLETYMDSHKIENEEILVNELKEEMQKQGNIQKNCTIESVIHSIKSVLDKIAEEQTFQECREKGLTIYLSDSAEETKSKNQFLYFFTMDPDQSLFRILDKIKNDYIAAVKSRTISKEVFQFNFHSIRYFAEENKLNFTGEYALDFVYALDTIPETYQNLEGYLKEIFDLEDFWKYSILAVAVIDLNIEHKEAFAAEIVRKLSRK